MEKREGEEEGEERGRGRWRGGRERETHGSIVLKIVDLLRER